MILYLLLIIFIAILGIINFTHDDNLMGWMLLIVDTMFVIKVLLIW